MKRCNKCLVLLPLDRFYPHPRNNDGLRGDCKACNIRVSREYQRRDPEKWRRYQREYREQNREKCLAATRRWSRSPEGKAKLKAWRSQPEVRKKRNKLHAASVARHPERKLARRAVYRARRDGKLVPTPCAVCSTTENIEAHHHRGYSPEHRLDVIWLCRRHHREADCDSSGGAGPGA